MRNRLIVNIHTLIAFQGLHLLVKLSYILKHNALERSSLSDFDPV